MNLAPEFLMTGAEAAGRLVTVKVTGEPEPAAIKEDFHRWPRRSH
ncbi:hypothetical protein [Paraburkholderia terrae]|nr:hypothetical protein [Paraburkholderia terrae]